ncbi:thioredoxin family protein [Sodalinema gerasimenkoae]|uniref:thioredoxin family protein n=1 Tax=Sodalinema gerasimenkoae TaxID=2862348 RepID=UPI001FE7E16C|nr:thioredoxin family protein [Sodalinema gerasimenkoae]
MPFTAPYPHQRSQRRGLLFSALLALTVVLTVLSSHVPAIAQAPNIGDGITEVYFFHSPTCPYCRQQEPLMHYIDDTYPQVRLRSYEVEESPEIWREFRERYNITSGGVPRTFIGDRSFIGYSEDDGPLQYQSAYQGYIGYRNQIIAAIEAEAGIEIRLSDGALTPRSVPWWLFAIPGLYAVSYPVLQSRLRTPESRRFWTGGLVLTLIISLFAFVALTPEGIVRQFADQLPFPLFVFTIAFVDGFNPCAFTVLAILLSLLTYTKNRRDMTLVGTTFVITSGVIYFISIILMITVGAIFLERYGAVITVGLGVIITLAALINIKDFFFFKKLFSLSLSEKQQKLITKKAAAIVRSLQAARGDRRLFAAALGGTILLSIVVNTLEFGCTAILPMIYFTRLFGVCQGGWNTCTLGWTAIYTVIYTIPLFGILLTFIVSFRSARVTESQGRVLKLLGGVFMLFFGLIMIFNPELLMMG